MKGAFTVALLAATIAAHGSALAQQQDKDQRKCINALNTGMAKVAATQLKIETRCAKHFAKEKSTDAVACWSSSEKVSDAAVLTCEAEAKKCTTTPSFGPGGCANVNSFAQFNAQDFVEELFGNSNPNAGIKLCSANRPGCKCQNKAVETAGKLYSTRLKSFNACKRTGLKDKTTPITGVAGLEACLSADFNSKVEKAETRFEGAIARACGDMAVFAAGTCAGLTEAALATCIENHVKCKVCITVVGADSLTTDCDLYDDGDTGNGSCFDDF